MTDTKDFTIPQRMAIYASAAAFADAATFPLDVAKVRLQVQGQEGKVLKYRSLPHTVATIVKEEGFRALYYGLVPGLQRQVCFTSVKFGLYDSVRDFYLRTLYGSHVSLSPNLFSSDTLIPTKKSDDPENHSMNVLVKIAAGLTTGFTAVCVAQPTDVVKIRFQSGTQSGAREKYKTSTRAYRIIYKEEGLAGLWKGTIPNCLRNGFINIGEIVVYDLVKGVFLKYKLMNDNIGCHFVTGCIAGFCATVIASPVDVVKTRYMNSPKGQYRGAMHVALETLKEGPLAFYKGFIPSFCRIATWNVVMWISFEQIKILVRKMRAATEEGK